MCSEVLDETSLTVLFDAGLENYTLMALLKTLNIVIVHKP